MLSRAHLRVGLAEHHPPNLDRVRALPHHARDGAGHHVREQRREERLLDQVGVVGLEQGLVGLIRARARARARLKIGLGLGVELGLAEGRHKYRQGARAWKSLSACSL